MADLAVIKLCPSKGWDTVSDCGICVLATITGKSYEDIVAAAHPIVGDRWKTGLYTKQLIAVAETLGVKFRVRRKYDLETDSGILTTAITNHIPGREPIRENHFVVLIDGRIYDSDLHVWAVDAFKQHYTADFKALLELV